MELLDRITVNTAQCGGRPCIRGMRIRVIDVLELLADDMTQTEILAQLPDLEKDEIRASLAYAVGYLDHPPLVMAGRQDQRKLISLLGTLDDDFMVPEQLNELRRTN